MDASLLFTGLVFGCIGSGFLMYGRKQGRPVPLVCGLLLVIVPWAIDNVIALVIVGVVLMAIPYFFRL